MARATDERRDVNGLGSDQNRRPRQPQQPAAILGAEPIGSFRPLGEDQDSRPAGREDHDIASQRGRVELVGEKVGNDGVARSAGTDA